MQSKEDYYSLSDIISHLRSFFKYILKRWLMVALAALVGIGIGLFYYYTQKPKYEAVTTFILEEKSPSGGGLAGLASQFGFDLGSLSGGGSIFTGDNILDILKSKTIGFKVLLSRVDEQNAPNETKLADLFLDFSGWKKKWASNNDLNKISFIDYAEGKLLSQKQDSVLTEIHKYIVKHSLSADRVNKKGSIIRLQVTAANSTFARLMTERMVDAAAKLYLDIKTGNAQANIAKLQRRSDSLLILLNHKSYSAATSQPLDINPGIRSAIVPVEIANRDKTVLATLYAEVTKNLEASKLLLSQQTPVIQLLDRPGYLLNDNKSKLFVVLILASLTAIMFYIIVAFPMFLVSRAKQNKVLRSE